MNLKNLTAKLFCKDVELYTGTAWVCSDQYVLTAAHCVVDLKNPQIYKGPFRLLFPSGEIVSDEIVWLDPEIDVAVLAIDPKSVVHLTREIKKLRSNPKPGNHASEDKDWAPLVSLLGTKRVWRLTVQSRTFLRRSQNDQLPPSNFSAIKADSSHITTPKASRCKSVNPRLWLLPECQARQWSIMVRSSGLCAQAHLSWAKAWCSQRLSTQLPRDPRRSRKCFNNIVRITLRVFAGHWLSWEANVVRPELVKDFLEGRPDVVHVDSQIYNLWDQFIDERAWHEDIANQLGQIHDSAAEVSELGWLVERIDRIDFSRTYRQLVLDFDDSFKNSHGRVKALILDLEEGLRQSVKRKDPVEIQTRYETQLAHTRTVNSLALYTVP